MAAPFSPSGGSGLYFRRTEQDARPPRQVRTAQLLGDRPPGRPLADALPFNLSREPAEAQARAARLSPRRYPSRGPA